MAASDGVSGGGPSGGAGPSGVGATYDASSGGSSSFVQLLV